MGCLLIGNWGHGIQIFREYGSAGPIEVNFGVYDLLIVVKMVLAQKLQYMSCEVSFYGAQESKFTVNNDIWNILRSVLRCKIS